MRSTTFPRTAALVYAICAGILLCNQASADGGGGRTYYYGREVTGGVILEREYCRLTIRERNGKERKFSMTVWRSHPHATIKIDGREATCDDIKVGMRVVIVYYNYTDGEKSSGADGDPLPMVSIKAKSNSPQKPS